MWQIEGACRLIKIRWCSAFIVGSYCRDLWSCNSAWGLLHGTYCTRRCFRKHTKMQNYIWTFLLCFFQGKMVTDFFMKPVRCHFLTGWLVLCLKQGTFSGVTSTPCNCCDCNVI